MCRERGKKMAKNLRKLKRNFMRYVGGDGFDDGGGLYGDGGDGDEQ